MSGFPQKEQAYTPPYMAGPRPGGGNWLGGCLIGCGITLFVVLIVAAIGAYFIWQRLPTIAADIAEKALVEVIDEIKELPQDDKRVIKSQIKRVVTAFKKGQINVQDMGEALEKIAKSPAIGAAMMIALNAQYLQRSGLSDDEKEVAARTVQRVWKGIVTEKIDEDDLRPAVRYIAEEKEEFDPDDFENRWQLKDKVTDEELRSFLDELKSLADNAEIPDQEYDVSIGNEIKKIVDELLGESFEEDSDW